MLAFSGGAAIYLSVSIAGLHIAFLLSYPIVIGRRRHISSVLEGRIEYVMPMSAAIMLGVFILLALTQLTALHYRISLFLVANALVLLVILSPDPGLNRGRPPHSSIAIFRPRIAGADGDRYGANFGHRPLWIGLHIFAFAGLRGADAGPSRFGIWRLYRLPDSALPSALRRRRAVFCADLSSLARSSYSPSSSLTWRRRRGLSLISRYSRENGTRAMNTSFRCATAASATSRSRLSVLT